jgi:hypothetical protein
MKRKIIISIGILIILVVTLIIETLVNYSENIKFRGVYIFGILVGIVINSLFQEIIFQIKTNKK